MSLASTVASVVWGLFFTRIVFSHLSGDLSTFGEKMMTPVLLIKIFYILGTAGTFASFVWAVTGLRPAIVQFKEIRAQPWKDWHTVTKVFHFFKFLFLTFVVLCVAVGILAMGCATFNTNDQTNWYHIVMSACLFTILGIQLFVETYRSVT